MTRIVITSRVGPDGILRLAVPVGPDEAENQMQVTIEPISPKSADKSDYHGWLNSLAGRWQGEFERIPPGEFEQRDML